MSLTLRRLAIRVLLSTCAYQVPTTQDLLQLLQGFLTWSNLPCRDEVMNDIPLPLPTHPPTHTVAPVINLTIAPLDTNRVTLTCSARGYPVLDSVVWERVSDGSAVSESVDQINGEESAMFDFSLTSTLNRDRSECNGVGYRCTVTQGSTRKSTSITCQIGTCMYVCDSVIDIHVALLSCPAHSCSVEKQESFSQMSMTSHV